MTAQRAAIVGCVGSTALAMQSIIDNPDWSLELVVTLPLEAAGRHSDFVDLADLAEEGGARLFRTLNSNSAECLQAVSDSDVDYIFVIGWSQICRDLFMNIKPDRIIGYHPAPLPRLRGRAALPWTILLQEPISAGSLMWLGKGVDDGDLLDQHFFHVAADETASTLYDKHQAALQTMLDRSLKSLADGVLPRQAQDARFATYAAKRTPADGLIDWTDSAAAIDRLVRAVGKPYPGAFTHADGNRLVVWRSTVLPDDRAYHAKPGQIVERSDTSFTVRTGDGLLRADEWETITGKAPRQHSVLGREAHNEPA